MKYCKDCAHQRSGDQCARPRPAYECPVRGVITPTAPTDCYFERGSTSFNDCGYEGRHFVQRP
jgi:hypothetical protein